MKNMECPPEPSSIFYSTAPKVQLEVPFVSHEVLVINYFQKVLVTEATKYSTNGIDKYHLDVLQSYLVERTGSTVSMVNESLQSIKQEGLECKLPERVDFAQLLDNVSKLVKEKEHKNHLLRIILVELMFLAGAGNDRLIYSDISKFLTMDYAETVFNSISYAYIRNSNVLGDRNIPDDFRDFENAINNIAFSER